jgi:hypothetical protein
MTCFHIAYSLGAFVLYSVYSNALWEWCTPAITTTGNQWLGMRPVHGWDHPTAVPQLATYRAGYVPFKTNPAAYPK